MVQALLDRPERRSEESRGAPSLSGRREGALHGASFQGYFIRIVWVQWCPAVRAGYTPLRAPDESSPGRPSLAQAKTPLLETALPKTAPVRAARLKSAPRKTAPTKTTPLKTTWLKFVPLSIAPAKRPDRLQTAGPFTAAAGRRRHVGPALVTGHPSAMLPTPSERRPTHRGFRGPFICFPMEGWGHLRTFVENSSSSTQQSMGSAR
jgi:hypothetical protein